MSVLDKQNKLRSFIQLANESLTRSEFNASFQQITRLVRLSIQQLDAKITARLATIKDGAQGPRGLQGPKGDSIQGPKGDTVVGPPGPVVVVDEAAIAARAMALALPEIEKRIPALSQAVRDALELLPEDERPDVSFIKGLEQHIKDVVTKHFPYSMGGGAVVSIMESGVSKVQQVSNMNFKGSGAPTISIGANGITDLDFSSNAGVTQLAATETPDGAIVVFTFAAATAKPSFIIADNVWLRATTKAGNTNWTWNAGTTQATMTTPPQDDILGII